MEIFCSFHEISGGECGHSSKDRARSVAHVPLLTCERNIQPHKAAFKFSGVDSEVDLILTRVSLFSRPKNVSQLSICPRHRELLGLTWKRPSGKCCIPAIMSGHSALSKNRPKAQTGLSKEGSFTVLRETGVFIPVGSGKTVSLYLPYSFMYHNVKKRCG